MISNIMIIEIITGLVVTTDSAGSSHCVGSYMHGDTFTMAVEVHTAVNLLCSYSKQQHRARQRSIVTALQGLCSALQCACTCMSCHGNG